MEIIERTIDELKPYKKNARINDDAVQGVMDSIKEFGFRIPIIIEKDGTIVAGHTRYKAVKKLGLKTVPCIIVDDLSEEQIKAFRLADNKVSEKAEWDFGLLDSELNDILNIDMTKFGFEFEPFDEEEEEPKPEKKENERVRTVLGYNLNLYDPARTEGKYGMPTLEWESYTPESLLGFNYVKSAKNFDVGIHFFIDDYQFERLWNAPEKYLETLKRFDCVLTPDFSLYLNMPLVMQMWNIYRSRLLGQYWQDNAITVIPTVSWGDEKTFDFCFDGLPERSTLAVSTVGILKETQSVEIFKNGIRELVKRKHPNTLVVYGRPIKDYDFEGVKTVHFSNSVTDRMDDFKRK